MSLAAIPTSLVAKTTSVMVPALGNTLYGAAGSRAILAATRKAGKRVPDQRRNFLTIVEQGHEGWRLSLGKNPVRLTPGLNLALPIYHSVQKVDLRECSIRVPDLPGYTADNVPVMCSGSLFFRITDSYKACFAVSDVEQNIRNIGQSAMRSVLGTFSYDQVIADRNGLNQRLNSVIGDSVQAWGVECTRFEIQSFTPANREVERQLELQMEAERNRRKQLLDTQAQINVAEGHKQRVILESEGHLEAKSNEADAAFKTIFREAEARQKQALLEAEAIAKQVESIARSLSPDESQPPSSEHRQIALQTLVELKRLEQLRAIAQSQNNSTYFFGDKSALGQSASESFNVDYAEQVKKGVSKETRVAEGAALGAL